EAESEVVETAASGAGVETEGTAGESTPAPAAAASPTAVEPGAEPVPAGTIPEYLLAAPPAQPETFPSFSDDIFAAPDFTSGLTLSLLPELDLTLSPLQTGTTAAMQEPGLSLFGQTWDFDLPDFGPTLDYARTISPTIALALPGPVGAATSMAASVSALGGLNNIFSNIGTWNPTLQTAGEPVVAPDGVEVVEEPRRERFRVPAGMLWAHTALRLQENEALATLNAEYPEAAQTVRSSLSLLVVEHAITRGATELAAADGANFAELPHAEQERYRQSLLESDGTIEVVLPLPREVGPLLLTLARNPPPPPEGASEEQLAAYRTHMAELAGQLALGARLAIQDSGEVEVGGRIYVVAENDPDFVGPMPANMLSVDQAVTAVENGHVDGFHFSNQQVAFGDRLESSGLMETASRRGGYIMAQAGDEIAGREILQAVVVPTGSDHGSTGSGRGASGSYFKDMPYTAVASSIVGEGPSSVEVAENLRVEMAAFQRARAQGREVHAEDRKRVRQQFERLSSAIQYFLHVNGAREDAGHSRIGETTLV
ncbi:MAG: hypothetical protein AAFX94_03205, partial [Myxococcota bacterium]